MRVAHSRSCVIAFCGLVMTIIIAIVTHARIESREIDRVIFELRRRRVLVTGELESVVMTTNLQFRETETRPGLGYVAKDDDDLREILCLLVGVGGPKHLMLQNTKTTDDSLLTIGRMWRIKTLVLSGTCVSDAGLSSLMELSVEELYLSDTRITDRGIRVISNLPSLRKLVISGTTVTNVGIKSFSQRNSRCVVEK